MLTHRLNGRDVSAIGLGTAHYGGLIQKSLAFDQMDAYVAAGGNLIDTARVYGDFVTPKTGESEKIVGQWMEERGNRKKIFLYTKGGHPPFDCMSRSRLSPREISSDLHESLADLRCNHIDVYFLHRDDESRPVEEIVDTLEGFVAEGLIRMYGVSNWKTERILEANRYAGSRGYHGIGANQPQFSLMKPNSLGDPTLVRMDRAMHDMHCRLSMPCFCFSSQAEGILSKKLSGMPVRGDLESKYASEANSAILEKIKALAAKGVLDADEASVAFLTCQPFPCFALCGSFGLDRIRTWGRLGNAGLPDGLVDELNSLTL
ncbi:MAG: aldo/keto reductase [Clostridia bacterium]|nr:aldo/keto reductase [Clostridia bacterium]